MILHTLARCLEFSQTVRSQGLRVLLVCVDAVDDDDQLSAQKKEEMKRVIERRWNEKYVPVQRLGTNSNH